MPEINLSTIQRIETDETLVDSEGKARKDALIFEDHIKCHPDMREQLETALKLFFNNPNF